MTRVGGRAGNRVVSDDVKGIILKCPRNWCFGTGASDGGLVVGILDSSDDNNYRLTIYKKGFLFVCLFVSFVCFVGLKYLKS